MVGPEFELWSFDVRALAFFFFFKFSGLEES